MGQNYQGYFALRTENWQSHGYRTYSRGVGVETRHYDGALWVKNLVEGITMKIGHHDYQEKANDARNGNE